MACTRKDRYDSVRSDTSFNLKKAKLSIYNIRHIYNNNIYIMFDSGLLIWYDTCEDVNERSMYRNFISRVNPSNHILSFQFTEYNE